MRRNNMEAIIGILAIILVIIHQHARTLKLKVSELTEEINIHHNLLYMLTITYDIKNHTLHDNIFYEDDTSKCLVINDIM